MSIESNFYCSKSLVSELCEFNKATFWRAIKKLDYDNTSLRKLDYAIARKMIAEKYVPAYRPNKKIQVFYNFKGGTGKTSVCYQTAAFFALLGFKCLLIDLDPQANLSFSAGINIEEDFNTIYDVIKNKLLVKDIIKNVFEGLDIIPTNISLTLLEQHLAVTVNRERVIDGILEPLKNNYDFILVDTNPSISTINYNALFCADAINVVSETQYYSFKGLNILMGQLEDFMNQMNKNFDIRIIANKYESKTISSREVLGHISQDFSNYLIKVLIRKSEDFNLSVRERKPLFSCATQSSYALSDAKDLAIELLLLSSAFTASTNKEVNNAA